jgi:hypothetical protein
MDEFEVLAFSCTPMSEGSRTVMDEFDVVAVTGLSRSDSTVMLTAPLEVVTEIGRPASGFAMRAVTLAFEVAALSEPRTSSARM